MQDSNINGGQTFIKTGSNTVKVLTKHFTFPLMLDMILYIQIYSDVPSHTGRPALSNVWLGNLHYREGGDGLSHPGPAPKHHSAVLRLPA